MTPYLFSGGDVIIDMSPYPIVRNATTADLVALEKCYDHDGIDDDFVKKIRTQTIQMHLQEQTSHFVWLWKTTAKKPLVLEQHHQIQAVLLYKLIEQPSWYEEPTKFFLVETIHLLASNNNQPHIARLLSHLQNNKEKFPVHAVAEIVPALLRHNIPLYTHGESV